MSHRLLVLVVLIAGASPGTAADIYQVTSKDGDKTATYEVTFGGGKLFDQLTAFDPETKKFVYLQWKRTDAKPAPVMRVWDHRTGETVPLYKFPDAKHPLPAIPSVDAMKVCPLTGDKNFKAKLHIIAD